MALVWFLRSLETTCDVRRQNPLLRGPEVTEWRPNSLSALVGDAQVTCGTMPISPLFKDHHLKPQVCPSTPFWKPPFQSSWHLGTEQSKSRSQSSVEWRLILARGITGRQQKEKLLLPTSSMTFGASPGKWRSSCVPPQSSAKTEGDDLCKQYLALSLELCSHSKIGY